MINIVIPMAGRGSRFAEAGYRDPKPLIDVKGERMIVRVIRNLKPSYPHRFIFICQEEHLKKYPLQSILRAEEPDCIIIPIDHITEGAACTVLLAKKWIDNNDPLMIANSDQYIDFPIDDYLEKTVGKDGLIMTMPANDPKWSFIQFDENGNVTAVREKEVISNEATVGIYNYSHGCDFVRFAQEMISKNERVNGEFYVAPAYNEMIAAGKKIGFFNIGNKMHGIGTPADLNLFLTLDVSDHMR